MNAVLFYVLAATVVAGSVAVAAVPRHRDAAVALGGTAIAIAVLSALVGAYALATAEFVIPVGCGAAVWALVGRNGAYRGLARPARWLPRRWWAVIPPAALLGVLFVSVFAVSGSAWHTGSGGASLLALLHYRAVYAFMLAVLLTAAGVATALLLGRTGDDERAADRAQESRRQREEREQRRREDREAARRRRGDAAPAAEKDG